MTHDADSYRRFEDRLAALEAAGLTPEEREITSFLIRVVRAARMTLWLTNGAVKWLAGPLGIAWGVYTYGAQVIEWLGALIARGGK